MSVFSNITDYLNSFERRANIVEDIQKTQKLLKIVSDIRDIINPTGCRSETLVLIRSLLQEESSITKSITNIITHNKEKY